MGPEENMAETWNPDAEPWEALREADVRAESIPAGQELAAVFYRRHAEALSEMGWSLRPAGSDDWRDGYDTGYMHGRESYAFAREAELEAEVERLREMIEGLREVSGE